MTRAVNQMTLERSEGKVGAEKQGSSADPGALPNLRDARAGFPSGGHAITM